MPPVAIQTRRWTRQEYERMGELGLFRPDERVQLLDGEIVTMTPQNSPHAAAIGKTERVLARVFGDAYWIRIQMPIVLDPDSEPEPDVAVVSGTPADYVQEHPRTAELIVEVSDSTLALDRERKTLLYARVGIPEYWIVNLPDRCVEVHREPVASTQPAPHYRVRLQLGPSDSIATLAKPDFSLRIADLLP